MTGFRNGQALPADDMVITHTPEGKALPVWVEDTDPLTIEEISPDHDGHQDPNKRYQDRLRLYRKNHPEEPSTEARKRLATPRVVDFRLDDTFNDPRLDDNGFVMTPKQIRRRAMRRLKSNPRMPLHEAYEGTMKPVAEWDLEELARGRPKNERGTFEGASPKWVSRQITEEAMERFKVLIREEMNSHTIVGLNTLVRVLDDERVDNKGKPFVSANVKVDIAKFLLEHVVGKPVQPTQSEVSVKLQAILGTVMVNPAQISAMPMDYTLAQRGYRGVGENPANLPPELEGIFDAELVDEDEEPSEE